MKDEDEGFTHALGYPHVPQEWLGTGLEWKMWHAFLAMERVSESLKIESGMFGNKEIYFSGGRDVEFVGKGLQR